MLRSITALVVVTALAALTFTASTASARRFTIDDQDVDAIRNDDTQRLTFEGGGTSVSCEVTLLGSFHSGTIAKVVNSLVGYIIHFSVDTAGCRGGRVSLLGTLPWHLQYGGFTSFLPTAVPVVNLIGAAFLIEVPEFGARCLLTTSVADALEMFAARDMATGQITSLFTASSIEVNDLPESTLCDLVGNLGVAGSAKVRDLDEGLVFIRLIA